MRIMLKSYQGQVEIISDLIWASSQITIRKEEERNEEYTDQEEKQEEGSFVSTVHRMFVLYDCS